jgi:hypothetical protein
MLASDVQKLRWFGVDMRPRWRRRTAVLATYAAYGVVVWVHSGVLYGATVGLFLASILGGMLPIVRDVYETPSAGVRRVGAVLIWFDILLVVFVALGAWAGARGSGDPSVALFAFGLLIWESPLRWNKLVDSGYRGWVAQAIRRQDKLGWWRCRRLARLGFATGLEGFAWYEYGVRFKKLTAEQKLEVEALRAANPRGEWMRERKIVLYDDERMRNEENELRARVQRVMTWLLVAVAMVFAVVPADSGAVRAETAVASLWTLAGLAVTLRQAMVLWTEVVDEPVELEVVAGGLAHAGE